jgi:hypothetical protein
MVNHLISSYLVRLTREENESELMFALNRSGRLEESVSAPVETA